MTVKLCLVVAVRAGIVMVIRPVGSYGRPPCSVRLARNARLARLSEATPPGNAIAGIDLPSEA